MSPEQELEHLRAPSTDPKQHQVDYWGRRAEKAEAEVERLRAELDQVREIVSDREAEITGLRATNAELLAALQRINRTTSAGTRTLDDFIRDMGWANDTARAAIAKAEEGK